MVVLGVFLHAVGGFSAGSFYIPFKKVRKWSWESYWLVNGLFAWIIVPMVVGLFTVPKLFEVIANSPAKNIMWSYIFGILWGIGGLTFGLSMRYLGMSLGYAIALGFCAAFGTIIPPIFNGSIVDLVQSCSGLTILAGVLVCLVGISVCGWAGICKERELLTKQKAESISEFNFSKGILVALFAGVMSSCMAFGMAAGKPIASYAMEKGTTSLWQNSPVLLVILAGGFTTNFFWCIFLNLKNKSIKDYVNVEGSPIINNYLFSALAGLMWYLQFMFYGMGTTKMGAYDFSSWTVHMAFVIVFSNLWGLYFKEWKGSGKHTLWIIVTGIFIVFLSTVLIGFGNYLAS